MLCCSGDVVYIALNRINSHLRIYGSVQVFSSQHAANTVHNAPVLAASKKAVSQRITPKCNLFCIGFVCLCLACHIGSRFINSATVAVADRRVATAFAVLHIFLRQKFGLTQRSARMLRTGQLCVMPQDQPGSVARLALPWVRIPTAVAVRAINCVLVHFKLLLVRAFGRLVLVRTNLLRAACFASSIHGFFASIAK